MALKMAIIMYIDHNISKMDIIYRISINFPNFIRKCVTSIKIINKKFS